MTVVASVSESRQVRHSDSDTPCVGFSGAQADSAPPESEKAARNEVQVWRHSCDAIKVSLAKQEG